MSKDVTDIILARSSSVNVLRSVWGMSKSLFSIRRWNVSESSTGVGLLNAEMRMG